jgi:hypothetical protein
MANVLGRQSVLAMAMEGHPSNLILGMKQQWN